MPNHPRKDSKPPFVAKTTNADSNRDATGSGGLAEPDLIAARLPEMNDVQFSQWVDLLESRTGMRLLDNRRSFLVTNLGMRMRELGILDYQEYYEHIQSGRKGSVEWDQLVHHLTVHETRFFRHQSTLDLIRDHCLPQGNTPADSKPKTLNFWSVGCSSGEEPYSIAMTVDQHMAKLDYEYYLGIIASDISRDALATGREGIYHARKLEKDRYQINTELQQRVCFNQVNILDMGDTPIGNMDAIICQNVLIYYDRERRLEIVNNLVKYLAPGGSFIFAVGELLHWDHPKMERFPYPNTLAYKRKTH